MNADESNNITNQRRIIRDYISAHEDLRSMTVTEKCDDGYSGTNMNRPGMGTSWYGKKQRVDCIIVKDMSRFAKLSETGKYIEQIFPFINPFIAINDNYDSKDYVGGIGEIDVQFKALLYDFYSKFVTEGFNLRLWQERTTVCSSVSVLLWLCQIKSHPGELLVDRK